MALKNLMARLQCRTADTPDTSAKIMGYQRKAPIHAGCTPDTPDTPRFVDTPVIVRLGGFSQAAGDLASAERPALENLQKPAMLPAANDAAPVLGLVTAGVVTPLQAASTEPAAMPDPDRWCWPHSAAMTGREIDTMAERTSLFNRRGMSTMDAELLADKLVSRDREADDRRLCLECAHLSRAGGLRCSQWQRAGLGAVALPAGMAVLLQRCDGFKAAT